MARGACTIRQRDVTRLVKGLKAGGVDVQRIEMTQEGSIVLFAGTPQSEKAQTNDLDRELAEWEEGHAG